VPVNVNGDAFILRAAVTNLLENAIDFSPPDGVVRITVALEDGNVVLCIRDHGSGIPDYAREKIFDRFYSLRHHSAKRKGTAAASHSPLLREAGHRHG
jgi:two-component system, OmpR family, sensor histidine kinase CreC